MALFDNSALRRRVGQLEDDLATQKRATNALQLDFENLFDQVRRTMARVAKRDQREDASERPNGRDRAPVELPPSTTAAGARLTPGQAAVNAEILRRRAGGQ